MFEENLMTRMLTAGLSPACSDGKTYNFYEERIVAAG